METQKQTLRPSPTAILNPRLDVNFKALFTQGTKESDAALKSFISAAVGRQIKSLKLDPNEPPVDAPSQMQMSFDVAVTFDDGEKAAIEVQGRDREYDFKARAEIQAARLLNNNAKKGGEWSAEKVYQISVLNFHASRDDKSQVSRY
ncbi:MAG: PD-(D/E)XK nuclease family transposase, partial [Treponema sp.]|nr:PD-(D/E)XK nuclease family transposase [Treponema sp.]